MMIARLALVVAALALQGAHADVEENVVYAMLGGLAMLMDVHYPERSNEFGIVFIPGSGWHAPPNIRREPLEGIGIREATRPAIDWGRLYRVRHQPSGGAKVPLPDASR